MFQSAVHRSFGGHHPEILTKVQSWYHAASICRATPAVGPTVSSGLLMELFGDRRFSSTYVFTFGAASLRFNLATYQGSTLMMGSDVHPPQQWAPGFPPRSSRTCSATSALLCRQAPSNPRRSSEGASLAASVMVSIPTRQGRSVKIFHLCVSWVNSMINHTCKIVCRPSR